MGERAKPGTDRPTEFRGCMWDDGWECDAPCVVYYPPEYARICYGGNNSAVDDLVEDICIDIADGRPHNDGGLDAECKARGWGLRGFARRKRAEHVVIKVAWDDDGAPEIVSRTESIGPPPASDEAGDYPDAPVCGTFQHADRHDIHREDPGTPEAEGADDLATARERLAELEAHPERMIRGAELEAKLQQWGCEDATCGTTCPCVCYRDLPSVHLRVAGDTAEDSGRWRDLDWRIYCERESDDAVRVQVTCSGRPGLAREHVADITVHDPLGEGLLGEAQAIGAALLWARVRGIALNMAGVPPRLTSPEAP